MKKKYIQGAINITIIPLLVTILLYGIKNTAINYLPKTIIISIISLIAIIALFKAYLSKNQKTYNISQFIAIFLNIILIFSIYTINNQYSYLSNIFTNKYIYTTNNIYVLKNTKYHSNNELKGKNIGILSNNNINSKKILNNSINNINVIEYNNQEDLINALYEGKVQSILLNDNEVEILKNNYNRVVKETRSVYEVKIKSEI